MWSLWLMILVVMPVALLVQRITSLGLGSTTSIQVASLLTFLWLVIAWLWPRPADRDRMLALTAGAAVVVQALSGLALDQGWLTAVRVALATVIQAGVTLAYYRWRVGDDNLIPHRPSDIVDLLTASLIGALVVLPLGPAPEVNLTSPTFDLFWWVILSTAHVFVGGACVMLLVQRRPRDESIPTRLPYVYLQLVVVGVCLALVFTFDTLPLTWIVLLPAVWAGLSMGPWTAAAYSITATLTVVVAHAIPAAARPYGDSEVTNILLLDSLMAAFVFIALLLSLVRDQRAHLAEEVLRRRQEALAQAGLLGTVFESISDALVLMDPRGGVLLHNRAAEQVLGPEKLEIEPMIWLRRMADESSFTYAYQRDGAEDGIRTLSVQLAPVQYAGADGVVAVARDITIEQLRIDELASFAAVAAHDLKGPLVAVQGWLELAEDSLGTSIEEVRSALEHSRRATDRMSREIEDWLAYNVAREGVMRPEPVQLQAFVEAVVANHPDADFVVQTPDVVMMDPTLLRHLMLNLVGNAVKYAPVGERASVTVRSFSGGDRRWVRLYVVDAGIGIPPGEEEAVFEPFRRSPSVQGTYDGSGLGLALCKRIVRRHGGVISARGNDGPGTTVTVTLPAG